MSDMKMKMKAEVTASVRKVLAMTLATALCLPSDTFAMTDEDIESGNLNVRGAHHDAIDQGAAAMELVIKDAVERALGAFVSDLRMAEGIDPDLIDQILGVQSEDL